MKFYKKKSFRIWMGMFFLLCGIFLGNLGKTKAASSYTNAREFYESTGAQGYHIEAYAGTIYYATKAKLASGSGNLKYGTVGYDICLSGKGQTVEFSVKRNGTGSMQEILEARVEYGNYEYNLYSISADKLYALATNASSGAAAVLKSSSIHVKIDAIMTTKKNNVLHGDVAENGYGGLNEWGTVYHLKNASDLAAMRKIFRGHDFVSFYDINITLSNHELKIRYKLNGGTVGNGYSSWNDVLYLNGSPVITQAKILQKLNLVNQNNIKLTKKGYHTVAGKEWTYQGRCFDQTAAYMPKDICAAIGNESKGITLEANWQVNVYAIRYNSNGGTGSMNATSMTYNSTGNLKKNVFTRNGYYFSGWNTRADGTGTGYADGQAVMNLAQDHGDVVTLYAQWKPLVFNITADKQGGTEGTDIFYEKYGTGWFADANCLWEIESILIPKRTGYNFQGYYEGILGTGNPITDAVGKILIPSNYFFMDARVYAHWEPKKFTITFDKQGGTGGTDSVTAVYGELLPEATAPIRTGYTFKGYYTNVDGGGALYYNEFMTENTVYVLEQDLTLYAYWVDASKPNVMLTANISNWTNREITLTAAAADYGAGLSALAIYCGDFKVAEKADLNGSMKEQLTFVNPTEGAVTYRAVAVDMDGNQAEAFRTVYYDITSPDGIITDEIYDGRNFAIKVEQVTDLNVQ